MKTGIIADTHFHHGNIIKYCHRPFLAEIDRVELERRGGKWHSGRWKDAEPWKISEESIVIMNDTIVNNTNATVGRDDRLIMIGDFALGPKPDATANQLRRYYQKCRGIRDRIHCQNIIMVWGNHDVPEVIQDLFSETHHAYAINLLDHHAIHFSHYPWVVWRDSHKGSWHGYGHCHTSAEKWLNKFTPGRRSIDLGVDNAYLLLGEFRPFLDTEVVKLLKNQPGFSLDPDVPLNYSGPEESETFS